MKLSQPRVVRRCKPTSPSRWRRTQTATGSQILRGKRSILYVTLFQSPRILPGDRLSKKQLSALFTAFNLNDWHTRGGRGGKRGYSLRLFAYTGRFRLGLLSSIFSLFLGNFKHGLRTMFSRYCVHLSAFPLLSYRSWLPGWTRVFPEAKDFSHISHRFKISPKLCCCRFCVARTLLSLVKLVKKGGGMQNACKKARWSIRRQIRCEKVLFSCR